MCHIICLWGYNTLPSSVTGDVSRPCWRLLLFMARAIRFLSFFSLPFLYSWQRGIILPILEWLQQRHSYSQGAVSLSCNSIHSQLDWSVIYRKSSPLEGLLLHTHWEFTWCVRSQVRTVQGSEHQWEIDIQSKKPRTPHYYDKIAVLMLHTKSKSFLTQTKRVSI